MMFWTRLKKIIQILLTPFYLSALLKGSAAGIEHKSVLQNLSFSCVIDVGANRGQFAIIARKVFPNAIIHSFEPLEEPAKTFKGIFASDPKVTLHTCAIGKEKTTSTIHVSRDDDSSSLLPITKAQSTMFPGADEKETRQVPVLPLSEALADISLPPASLLKIDVQGYELGVLQGCEDILKKFSHLYIECSFLELYEGQSLAYQVISWLEKRNFILSGIHNMYYQRDGTAVQGDFLFSQVKS
jgi:FkbM family methyltransferase